MASRPTSTDQIQARLLVMAALFVSLYAAALAVVPLVRPLSGQTGLAWQPLAILAAWLVMVNLTHRQTVRWLPGRDPYLLPAAVLLSGWGILSIWRLLPPFGLRQLVWLAVSLAALVAGLRLPSNLRFLRRYKYVWLTAGLALTGLTLILGTNPEGFGPRMWLGCCGVYLQPSEPLKLLLVVYLAAYMADMLFLPSTHSPRRTPSTRSSRTLSEPLLTMLAPTIVLTGIALLLLLVQRDLGTASIFLFLYTLVVYVVSGRKSVLVLGGLGVVLAGFAGYMLFDVVRLRVDAWLNPWADPSGRSYQIVQSLLAIANGGLVGRGPGLGNPGLVPVPHSDFIFSAIVEENGLAGGLGLLALVALLANRGLRIAVAASDSFRRYLAAGLTIFLVSQSILIIGGNLRMLPLTGVTLPFVSYGGSSLLTAYLSLLILLHISNRQQPLATPLPNPRPYLHVALILLAGLLAAALVTGWWSVYRAPELLARTDNPRRAIADRSVRRGAILDRNNTPIAASVETPEGYIRQVLYPQLSTVTGYNDPIYGQSGLEASLDEFLRGVVGNPETWEWREHLLYGTPPPGLDIRLSLDLSLQRALDEQMQGKKGSAVLVDPASGELLAMASHPGFDANLLGSNWDALVNNPDAPLLDRTVQGLYPTGAALGPLLLAATAQAGAEPELPAALSYATGGQALDCALPVSARTLGQAVVAGCPGATAKLGESLGSAELVRLFSALGLYQSPQLRLPGASISPPAAPPADAALAALGEGLAASPLQMALAASPLSNKGTRPAALLVTERWNPIAGWQSLPPLGEPVAVFTRQVAERAARRMMEEDSLIWKTVALGIEFDGSPAAQEPVEATTVTWFIGGTSPDWPDAPRVLVVLLEENNPAQALKIGQALLSMVTSP